MENMNLLNNLFSIEDITIKKNNRIYLITSLLIILILSCVLIIKINRFYINSYSIMDNKIMLLVEKEVINDIKTTKEIILKDLKTSYSINSITPVNDNYLVNINLTIPINNINSGEYKIYLGKERLFDYIIRIIKK